MTEQLSKVYQPKEIEKNANEIWISGKSFHARTDISKDNTAPYCIVIPPPNVTAALHLGHALNNTLQDILIRFKRMQGFNTLWMPGTDHAGIATQTVVEKRILSEENKRRTDFQRDEFVARVQAWKDEYEACIIGQLKAMGCSCDWDRTRFTMDEVCAKAVRATFFKLFKDGLIYRGKRLVNWDPATQTVLADDEVEHESIQGFFWYLRYPLVEPVTVPCGTGFQPVNVNINKRKGAYLPHGTKTDATYAVTFRLADSLPLEITEQWRAEKERIFSNATLQNRNLTLNEQQELLRLHSDKIESYLNAGHGQCYLGEPIIAETVTNALKYFDGQRYDLIAWVVMPNHVHVILKPYDAVELSDILHSWKSYTANKANELLGRTGDFWNIEYYDHLIRDEKDFLNQINYVLSNPSKAGLENWSWVGAKTNNHRHLVDDTDKHGQDARAKIEYVTVATTRPETMLGDTAVAMNPADPRAKYLIGKKVRLPIVGRIIPIIADEHVVLPNPDSEDEKAKFSTGFLKVTPAHDPDDWAIGQRHNLPVINVMAPDGSISDKHGWEDVGSDAEFLLGMDRFEAREAIVEWFRKEKLLEDVREYTHEVGHSYRSHVPIEPYLSDQWYIAVKKPISYHGLPARASTGKMPVSHDLIEGTDIPVNSLAGLALKPLLDGRLRFIPERYAKTYQSWLENLRDWPISRQLWWGHRIPVWWMKKEIEEEESIERLNMILEPIAKWVQTGRIQGYTREKYGYQPTNLEYDKQVPLSFLCVKDPLGEDKEVVEFLEVNGFEQDFDVLDTWFSSALWPFSTLGWPDETPEFKTFYPGNVLCTAREIITLWVSRMVMMGQYCAGDIPFSQVYIHAMIQDGEGRKMSKSLGNGIDPLVAIDSHGADAMRFTLASMTTETQDVRMPVIEMTLPDGRKANSSPKFDNGRNFCNKLWNASRFAMMNLEGIDPEAFDKNKLAPADKWILSRLAAVISETTDCIDNFKFSEPINDLYKFFWNDFCDWYL
ncbi:MAG: class I tRNA ligase family protein, partial [Phycisphaerae bacterium]